MICQRYNFVRSGYLHPANASLMNAGNGGGWWSSYGEATIGAYHLYITVGVNPSNGSGSYAGFPLRCLSTVLGM